jgi:hypothetical protein
MYEYGTFKPVEISLRVGVGKRKNNGEDKPKPGHIFLYTYMEMSQ